MEKVISAPAVETGISGAFESLRVKYDQYRLYRRTINELSSLSDRSLSDLGLSRAMIKGLAHETAYGQ
ncbi:DUF1127 domain-containing protein [Tropicimonas marinistellae]|uniref:DUF1127 domain-containing protein n=1 Tax=Tropicimonas marinistellae TaxID=1739787 RepID=UPI001F46CAAE|nr:DUF1127 domain-containing protein [Tropicimonas marinistellae]